MHHFVAWGLSTRSSRSFLWLSWDGSPPRLLKYLIRSQDIQAITTLIQSRGAKPAFSLVFPNVWEGITLSEPPIPIANSIANNITDTISNLCVRYCVKHRVNTYYLEQNCKVANINPMGYNPVLTKEKPEAERDWVTSQSHPMPQVSFRRSRLEAVTYLGEGWGIS